MGETTRIEYADHTWSPWIGCSRVHTGCEHCFAEAMAGRLGVIWGPRGTRRKTSEAYWREPLRWNRKAEKEGVRLRVFPSLCDVFEGGDGAVRDSGGNPLLRCDGCGKIHVDNHAALSESCECGRFKQWMEWLTLHDLRRDFFALIDRTPNIDWILLTKRPENIRYMWGHVPPATARENLENDRRLIHRPNAWPVYSASDQATLEAGLPHLLACRDLVPVLGLSLEPLVGPVDLTAIPYRRRECPAGESVFANDWETLFMDALTGFRATSCFSGTTGPHVDWVIVGGESGPHARPCNVEWIKSVVGQCKASGVPCFVKQDSGRKSGQQGRIPDDLWAVKELPRTKVM